MSKGIFKRSLSVTAYWGNDDAESTIELAPEEWAHIEAEGECEKFSESCYEGVREEITWTFGDCTVSIDGEDARQCLVEEPISQLFVE